MNNKPRKRAISGELMLYLRQLGGHLMALANPNSLRYLIALAGLLLSLMICTPSPAQSPSKQTENVHEMLLTEDGFIAIDTPKGWVRADGPGLAFFVHQGDSTDAALVWIYINSAPVGPKEEAKCMSEYIASDIAGFKKHFKKGSVRKEAPIKLPNAISEAPVYTFLSGENSNAFEQTVYVTDHNRVLILALSAKEKDAFDKALEDFRKFAQSYRGNITVAEPGSR